MEPKQQEPDFFGVWRGFLDKQQETMEQLMHQMMKTQQFAAVLDKQVEISLTRKQMTQRMYEQMLRDVPIPTQEDMTRLAGQVVDLDAKVDRLEVYLEESLEPMVKGLQAQLSRIEGQFSLLLERLDRTDRPASSASTERPELPDQPNPAEPANTPEAPAPKRARRAPTAKA